MDDLGHTCPIDKLNHYQPLFAMRFLIITHLALFSIGFYLGLEISGSRMPESIFIERDGEVKGFANLAKESSKIVNIYDNDNPGAYLAFPIYRGGLGAK